MNISKAFKKIPKKIRNTNQLGMSGGKGWIVRKTTVGFWKGVDCVENGDQAGLATGTTRSVVAD